MISRFFIYRPIFATVISIVIIIAGGVSLLGLPSSKFPDISPPTVSVQAFYPGASAEVVAETVAAPIEDEVNGVEGMIYMSSVCASDGSYNLTVTFEIGTDIDMATVLVQNRVTVANSKLPEPVRQQGVTTRKQSTQILQFITLTSTSKDIDEYYLSNFALDIKDELARIHGVGFVQVFGAGDYSMRIWLDPDRMDDLNLTTDDLMAALRENNVQVAAGQIGSPPAPDGQDFTYTVNTKGRLTDAEEFGAVVVKSENGREVRVRDVARVERGAKEYIYFSRLNGQPCAAVGVYQLPGANALETADSINAYMQERRGRGTWPDDVAYEVPFDTTLFVVESIQEVYVTIAMAIVLVVAVIFIFLQDWRTTLIPCAAIPVSLVGTFAVMMGLGFSINMLSLFGIVLAIGIVVDDSIVVVENSMRHIEAGLAAKQAAVKAMEEITGPVIATTLVLLAVFVPTAFMGGITGQLYRQFALTISAAVVFSTINALTLSPALCGILLRPGGEKKFVFFRWFNRGFDGFTSGYSRVIGVLVRRLIIVGALFAGLLCVTGWGFDSLPTGFVPEEDQGYVFVNIQLPDAASKQRTDAVVQKVDQLIQDIPGIKSRVMVTGYSLLTSSAGSNVGMGFIVFDPWDQRTSPAEQQQAILAEMRKRFAAVPEASVAVFVPPAIDGLGSAGGFQMEVRDVADIGYENLQGAVDEMVAVSQGQTSLVVMPSTFRSTVPQLFVDRDDDKIARLQVPKSSVDNALSAFLGAAYVNDYTYTGRTYQVRMQAEADYRSEPADIRQLSVRSRYGEMIPLGTFVTIEQSFGPPIVRRYNTKPSAAINGGPRPGYSSGQALAIMEGMAEGNLPSGADFQWTGMAFQEKAAGKGQYLIFLLAVVFVFLVLAAQYESWSSPAAVIAVVPLAALGVVIALVARGMDNNVYTQIGIVLLVALASKNAILIVEFARELRREGKAIGDAAVTAARLRFRAILMTAFSSILGFLPLVIATGAGAASRQAVGTAVVGGMMAATVFSLVLVPSFFVVFQRLGEAAGGVPPQPTDTPPQPPEGRESGK